MASREIDFFTATAGSQLFESLPEVVDMASEATPNALFTLPITDGRSVGATVLFERYEARI